MDPDLGSIILLKPAETMEVEWMGCEFIDDGGLIFRADQIRLAKTMKIKSSSLNNVVGVYDGWTTEDIISFKNNSDVDARCSRLTTKSKHKFDINELFEARAALKEKENDKIDPTRLH